MAKIQENGAGGNAFADGDYSYAEGGAAGDGKRGAGGDGGHAHAIGPYSIAVGGRGGRGGTDKGGPGGEAIAMGHGDIYYGGDGGESSQSDGRGGRGGSSQMLSMFGEEFARRSTMKLPYGGENIFPGRGGDTPDTPQYMARRLVVEQFKISYFIARGIPTEGGALISLSHRISAEWMSALMEKNCDVWYDRTLVPIIWVNERLRLAGHRWQALVEADEYVFIDDVA